MHHPWLHRMMRVSAIAALWLSQSAPALLPSVHAQGPDLQRVEIVIDDFAFVLARPVALRLGVPTALILRNRDIVRHGFASPAFPQLALSADGEGIVAYGKGIEGVYVDPGKTLVLYFTPERGGSYTFHCDLHQQMKGELYTLDLPAA